MTLLSQKCRHEILVNLFCPPLICPKYLMSNHSVLLVSIVLGFREPSHRFLTSLTYYWCLPRIRLGLATPSWTSLLYIHDFSTFLFMLNFWLVPRMLCIQLWLDGTIYANALLGVNNNKAHNYSLPFLDPSRTLTAFWYLVLYCLMMVSHNNTTYFICEWAWYH